MSNNKKHNKANLRYSKSELTQAAKDTTSKKKKMTFMQWVKVTPVWYLVFGLISLGAVVYGCFHQDFFASDGETNRIMMLIVFFFLGVVLIYLGAKYIRDGEDLPENRLFKMFTTRK